MIPAKNETALRILICTAGLILLWLLLEASLPMQMADHHPSPRLFHLILALLVVILLIAFKLLNRKTGKTALAVHFREMSELQREMDKTAYRYKCLLEGAGNAIFVFNVEDGVLQEVNRKGTELLGFSREEMSTLHGRDLVPAGEQAKFSALVRRVRRRGRARTDDLTFKRKNGDCFQGEIDARLIDLGNEKVAHVIVRDITFKRRAELEIRQRNRELSILINFMARANQTLELHTVLDVTLRETIEVFGADGGVIHLLEEGDNLQLAATHEISSRLKVEIDRCSLGAESRCYLATTRHCHSIPDMVDAPCSLGRLTASDGWHSSAAAPLLAQNRLIGIMHIFTRNERLFTAEEINLYSAIGSQIGVVIEHARLFEELNWKNEELLRSHRLLEKSSHQLALSQRKLNKNLAMFERANLELGRLDQMKNHFLGMISHEFRTPLTGIMGGAEFLLSSLDNVTDDERKLLRMIYDGGARLNEIVIDLLNVAKLEAKTGPLNKSILHLTEIMDLVQEQFEQLLQDRNQHLVCENLDLLPYFNGDRKYLEEVFAKLLENAVKFSPDGGDIVISARVTDCTALLEKKEILSRFNSGFCGQMGEQCYLEVEVRDSGVGIDSDEEIKIFEKFYEIGDIRYHSSGKHKFQGKGAGLGLTIVKGMVEAHGGMVWVESPAGAGLGSSFFILLPLEEGPRQPAFPFMHTDSSGPAADIPS